MAAANIPATITSTETIEIDFYTNSKIVLSDNGKLLRTMPLGALPGIADQAKTISAARG